MDSPNLLAVLVAAVSGFVIGGIWYGPLFGKLWMRLTGITEEEVKSSNFVKIYGVSLVMNFIAAYVLAHVLEAFSVAMPEVSGVMAGVQGGFWSWLGFVLSVRVTDALFNRASFKLVWVDSGYRLIWLIAMGIILAVW